MPPLLRPSVVVRVTRALPATASTTTTTVKPTAAAAAAATAANSSSSSSSSSNSRRSFSITTRRSGGASGQPESRYDPPTGWLWGIKPGQKYEKEGWETPFYALYCTPLVLVGIYMLFKPDTTIQTWALEEARRRLEKEGILEDPYPDHVEPENQNINKE